MKSKEKKKKKVKLTIKNLIYFFVFIVFSIYIIIFYNLYFSKEVYATEGDGKEEVKISNANEVNLDNIILNNTKNGQKEEYEVSEETLEYITKYKTNNSLPKGVSQVVQEGRNGKQEITTKKTYENGEFVEEVILSKEKIADATPKNIDVGTSEFLAKHNVHIGDTMYFVDSANMKKEANDESEDVAEVKASIDVTLLELPTEEWAKVSFDNIEGYVKTSNLTSSYTTPNIVEKNRIQRILLKVNIDMELNRVSGLTLNDYQKIFIGLSQDQNKIFQNNYAIFYNIEKKYNINGIFSCR